MEADDVSSSSGKRPSRVFSANAGTSTVEESANQCHTHHRTLRKRNTGVSYTEEEDKVPVYDCCFIKVTGLVYERWKKVRDNLGLWIDEDLVMHFLDSFEKDRNDPCDQFDNDSESTPRNEQKKIQLEPSTQVDSLQLSSGDEDYEEIVCLPPNWCSNCDEKHQVFSACPLLNPEQVITDAVIDFSSAKNSEFEAGSSAKSYAQLSLPSQLSLKMVDTLHGLSVVVSGSSLQSCTQLGPLLGEMIQENDIPEEFDMKHLWLVKDSDNSRSFISTANPEKSNWLRYLRPSPSRRERNLGVVVRQGLLYFVTLQHLAPNAELLYWIDDPDLIWTKKRAEKSSCGSCNLQFDHPLYYRLHCSIFHDPYVSSSRALRKYDCKVCGVGLVGKEAFVKHAIDDHSGKGAYQCQNCNKYFLRHTYLEMHRTHGCHQVHPAKTGCDLCGRKFNQSQKLRLHMLTAHEQQQQNQGSDTRQRDFQCPTCGKVLGSRHAVQRHRKEVHYELLMESCESKSEDFSSVKVACPKCTKTFKNKSNLKIHMLTHSGVKPFGCKEPECKQGFTTKQCLQFHYKKSHGYTDDNLPKIEREIPYTLAAYSGGIVDSPEALMVNERTTSLSPDTEATSDQASLLVAAALSAAEQDLSLPCKEEEENKEVIQLVPDQVPNPEPFGKSPEEAAISIEENPGTYMSETAARYLPGHYSTALERLSTSSRFANGSRHDLMRYNSDLAELTARYSKPTPSTLVGMAANGEDYRHFQMMNTAGPSFALHPTNALGRSNTRPQASPYSPHYTGYF